MQMFRKVLVANRGEIAVRIIRTCRLLDVKTVAVYSDCDAGALHVKLADEAMRLGSANPGDSYLNIAKIVRAAADAGVDAVHPGYGFVSENWNLAAGLKEAGVAFVGPDAKTLALAGNKIDCKRIAKRAGVPVIGGSDEVVNTLEEARAAARDVGYPVLLKSAFGGGGRGIREVATEDKLEENFSVALTEMRRAFGRAGVYVEQLIRPARHIEVQVVSDGRGNIIHLGERECSIQRRHQKLLEVTPSPAVDGRAREKIGRYAVAIIKALGYKNIGTVEFLLDGRGEFHFVEVNARLQVEHPITEEVSGVDLVREQLLIAAGDAKARSQKEVSLKGAALQCRINAEDPEEDFAPSTGTIEALHFPGGPGIRVDSALYQGYDVPEYYDSLIAKVIAWGNNLEEARRRMSLALQEMQIEGVSTTVPLHRLVISDDEFRRGKLDVSYIERTQVLERLGERMAEQRRRDAEEGAVVAAAILASGHSSRRQRDVGAAHARRHQHPHKGARFHDAI